MAFCGLPMYWKKPEETIWNPAIGNARSDIFSPISATLSSVGSSVNIPGHEVGKEVAQNEAEGGDAYGAHDVQFQCPDDAVELTAP